MAFRDRDEWADAVRQAVDLSEIVGRHVSLKRKGRHMWGLCPFHQERTPSFSVDVEQQLYYCFGCHKGGNVFTFLMEVEGLEFPQAVESLAEIAGIERPQERGTDGPLARLRNVMEYAQTYYLQSSLNEPQWSSYLDRRKISADLRKTFGLGWAPDRWDGLAQYLIEKGVSRSDLEAAGVVLRRRDGSGVVDRWRGRLMFPIWDGSGRVVAFGGRALGEGQEPKYLNSPDTDLFRKGTLLYGVHLARGSWRRGQRPLLVEGYFDVLAFHAAGISQAVASLGTALTESHAHYLSKYHEAVDLCYDQDHAGHEATRRAYLILSAAGMKVNVIRLPGKDPAELWEQQGPEPLQEAVNSAHPYVDEVLSQMQSRPEFSSPRGKAELVKELRVIWEALPDPVEKTEYLGIIARTMRVQPRILAQSFGVPQGSGHTFEKNRHNMGEASARRIPSVDVRLIATLLQSVERLERVNEEVPEWCQRPPINTVLEAIRQGLRAENMAQWAQHLDEAARDLIVEALACDLPDGGIGAIDEYVRAIKLRTYEMRWNEMKERIRQGDTTPELFAEVQSIQQTIQRFKAQTWSTAPIWLGKEG